METKVRKILILFLCLSIGMTSFSDEVCVKSESVINKNDFKIFIELVKSVLKDYKLEFKVEENNEEDMIFTTNEISYKIKGKTPIIGEFPTLSKPKWKKEKIKVTALVKDNSYCLNFDAYLYSKKDKKWYAVKAPSDFNEKILDKMFLESLKGKSVWSVGSPMVLNNGNAEKLLNLKKFKIEQASVSFITSKSIEISLKGEEEGNVNVSIPFIGDIKKVQDAYNEFKQNFISFSPRNSVAPKYDFFWEYAIHGEIMNGMHKNQLITAFGLPYSIEKLNNNEKWYYFVDGRELMFKIFNDELILPDDYKW